VLLQESVSVHPTLGAKPDITNRGGVRCQLCNAFKLRKDHLKLHYIKHHGYMPKLAGESAFEEKQMVNSGIEWKILRLKNIVALCLDAERLYVHRTKKGKNV
jgi:hypothetical protein